MKRKFVVVLFLAVMIFNSLVFANERGFFHIVNNKGAFKELVNTRAKSNKWKLIIISIQGHGVGRVFKLNGNWASGLYTYGPHTEIGARPPKPYYKTKIGEGIVWKMRKDTDYSAPFTMMGSFEP